MFKKNYRIDFAANTVTKKFLEEAGSSISSAEFKDNTEFRRFLCELLLSSA